MFIAVDSYKSGKDTFSKYIGIFLCVPVFILSGLEHCVADMFYLQLAGAYSLQALSFILLASLGNTLGAFLIPLFTQVLFQEKAATNLVADKKLELAVPKSIYRSENLYRREQLDH